MGNAVIWYYPTSTGAAERIDLLRHLTALEGPTLQVRQSVSESFTGHQWTTQYGARNRLRYRLEWAITGAGSTAARGLYQSLVGLCGHLRRGGTIVLAEDETYAWASFAKNPPPDGSTTIYSTGSFLDELAATVSVATREIVIRSAGPVVLEERRYVSTHTAGARAVTISDGLSYDYGDQSWVLLREAGTWPALRLPREARSEDLLTTRGGEGLVAVLDLPLEEAENGLEALADAEQVIGGTTVGTGINLTALEQEESTVGWSGSLTSAASTWGLKV